MISKPVGVFVTLVLTLAVALGVERATGIDVDGLARHAAERVLHVVGQSWDEIGRTAETNVRSLQPAAGAQCKARGDLPDPTCSPGDVMETRREVVCVPGYSRRVRDVDDSLRDRVIRSYGLDPDTFRGEVDHIVPLSLGGSNDQRNLWPQPGKIPNPKDKVEARLRRAVCDEGTTPLADAQRRIAADWTAAR